MWKNVVLITAHFLWDDCEPASSICWAFVRGSRSLVAEERRTQLACTPYLLLLSLFLEAKCLHVQPAPRIPPSLPLIPSLISFITGSWVVEKGPLYIVLAFLCFKSSPQSGWEGIGGGSQQAPLGCEGSCRVFEWAEGI